MLNNTNAENILNNWAKSLMNKDINAITSLYHPNALLFPTFSSKERSTPETIRAYFTKLFGLENLSVSFQPPLQHYPSIDNISGNNLFILSGLYTFSYTNEQPQSFLARYTFVVEPEANSPEQGFIHHHHSSLMPVDA